MYALASAINLVADIFILILFADILLSYILDPYHPIRHALDSIVEPFLAPIRRILPNTGMFDLSPMVLSLLIWLLASFLTNILTH